MRILHVIPTIALSDGGPAYAVRRMSKVVAAAGHDVDVIATSFGTPQGAEDRSRTWEYDEDGVRYRLFPRNGPWAYNLSFDLTRWVFAHAGRFDVMHVHAPFSYTTWPACNAAMLHGVPYVYRTLGTMDPWSLRHKSWKKWPYYRLIERRNMAHATTIHATAASERQAIASLGFGAKVSLVPLGVDVGEALEAPPPSPVLRVCYLSRIHEKKGIPLLLEALATLEREAPGRIRLVLAGSGEAAYEAEIARQIDAIGVGELVDRVGFVDGDAKRKVLRESDVFVLPAYDENFGIAVVEAMAAARPVVVTDAVGVAPDIARADAGIVVRTGDAVDVARALRTLRDDTTRRRMGKNARALVESEFSTHAMGERLVAMYRRVCAGDAGPDAPRGEGLDRNPPQPSSSPSSGPGCPRSGANFDDASAAQ